MINTHSITDYNERFEHAVSLALSLILMAAVLFYTPSIEIIDEIDVEQRIQVVNIDKIASPKRVTRKQISTEEGEPTTETRVVERARGTSLEESAVDMAFFPNIVPPRPLSKFKKIYPKIAKEQNIEAILNTVLLISADGIVLGVNVVAVRLTKSLPPDIYAVMSAAFTRSARKILLGARFTPPIVEGKRVPIKMELPLRFKLAI